jgi:hypothetical protein
MLLARLKDWETFEHRVCTFFHFKGYEAERVAPFVRGSGDGGVDVVAWRQCPGCNNCRDGGWGPGKCRAGNLLWYVQCKYSSNSTASVGRDVVQKLLGATIERGAREGVYRAVFTTGRFSSGAIRCGKTHGVHLITNEEMERSKIFPVVHPSVGLEFRLKRYSRSHTWGEKTAPWDGFPCLPRWME